MPRKMKESGVEWLGQIPEGWKVCRCKFILCRNDGGIWGNDPVDEDGEFVLRSTEQTIDGNWEVIAPAKRDLSAIPNKEYFLIRAGDLLVTKSSGSALHIGKTTLADEEIEKGHYYYSNFLQRLRFDSFTVPRFVWYLMNSCIARQQFVYRQNSTSGIGNINAADIDELKFPRPPLPDQQRIAAFLDERCAKIDGMIFEAKASIEDYKKWKQSIIFEAVTGKHEKNLKPSGVDWIGDVPEGWKVCRLKNVASVFGRIGFRGYTTEDLVAEGDGAISLSPSNLKDMYMDFSKRTYISWAKYEESPEIKVAEGDIVFVKTGSSYGKSCLVRGLPEKATLNPQLVVIKNISCNNDFLQYVLQTPFIRYQVELIVSGGTIPTMSQEKMGRFSFVLPSKNVQHRIAAELDEKCAAIDKLVGEKESLIADLEAYKKSLIFETVTGKREVA